MDVGVRECDIAAEIYHTTFREGADGVNFASVKSGINSALIQPFTSIKKLEEGDLVQMDIGMIYEGYSSDLTRTVVVGNPSKKQKEIFTISLEAQESAIKSIRPGILASEVDSIARNIIEEAGYGKYFPHLTGHGVGTDSHEFPIINQGVDIPLKTGMVVTVEPGIYVKELGGARTEDMVLITSEGFEVLTQCKRKLEL
ncbi:MAG: M24 family metallopeptidase [Candidatus Hodarchaeota archaeon]